MNDLFSLRLYLLSLPLSRFYISPPPPCFPRWCRHAAVKTFICRQSRHGMKKVRKKQKFISVFYSFVLIVTNFDLDLVMT
jgi:hypothetical protein